MRKSIHSIDLAKFIGSLLVITLHTYPFYEKFPNIGFISSNVIGRIVIPFFLVSAGYFLKQGIDKNGKEYLIKYIKRLTRLYLLWSIIHLPAAILFIQRTIQPDSLIIWPFIFVVCILYAGTYYHLWYMPALIFASLFCFKWLKHFTIKTLLIFGFIMLCIGLSESYFGLLQSSPFSTLSETYFRIFYTTRNGLFMGIFYVALGIYIANKEIAKTSNFSTLLAFIFFILLFSEAQILRNLGWAIDYNFYLMSVPFIYYLFITLLKKPCSIPLNYKSLREYSTLFYFSHGMFIEYIPFLLPSALCYLQGNGLFRFVSVMSCTAITSFFVKKYFKKLY